MGCRNFVRPITQNPGMTHILPVACRIQLPSLIAWIKTYEPSLSNTT